MQAEVSAYQLSQWIIQDSFNKLFLLWNTHSIVLTVPKYSSRLTYICDFIVRSNIPLSSLVPSESYEDYVSRSSAAIKQIVTACPNKGKGFRSLYILLDTFNTRNRQRSANRNTFIMGSLYRTEFKVDLQFLASSILNQNIFNLWDREKKKAKLNRRLLNCESLYFAWSFYIRLQLSIRQPIFSGELLRNVFSHQLAGLQQV